MLKREELDLIKKTIESDYRFITKINEAISYTGKESGHSHASPMEETIREILVDKLEARNSSADRSLADVFYKEHLINVKFGSPKLNQLGKPKFGQPNMCAMNRIMKQFYSKGKIDSYYIIKVNLKDGNHTIHVFDMLDYIDYLTWNSGTGQIMLKEAEFYSIVDTFNPSFTLDEKKKKIKELYDVGCEKHILLRIKQYINQSSNRQRFVDELQNLLK